MSLQHWRSAMRAAYCREPKEICAMQFMLLLPALPRIGDDAPRVFSVDQRVSRSVLRLDFLLRRANELVRRLTAGVAAPPIPLLTAGRHRVCINASDSSQFLNVNTTV
jgi:hypothetical protein